MALMMFGARDGADDVARAPDAPRQHAALCYDQTFVMAIEASELSASAQRPYTALDVALHTGGRRYPVDPMSAPAFPDGPGLSLDALRFAVERLRAMRAAGDSPLVERLGLWPAPDPLEHAQPAAVWSLLRQSEIGEQAFHANEESRLTPTDGARLGTAPDWRRILEDLRQVGVRHVWFTFLGLESTHDTLVNRTGAFAAVVAAMERCAAVGLATGANIVVSRRNIGEIGELAVRIRGLGAERFVPTYVEAWSQLRPAYEQIRPTPDDLAGLPPTGLDVNWGYHEFWSNPSAFTEGVLTRAAREGSPSEPLDEEPGHQRALPLSVDGNFDVFVGSLVTPPVQRVGNLRDDAPESLYNKLSQLSWPPQPPTDAQLAQWYGDSDDLRVHMGRFSVRRKWLSEWRAAQRLAWLVGHLTGRMP